MSKEAILGAIRRGLKRGPLPADQRAMLEGRLATHPRHLIPQRSRLPRAEQVTLFVKNVEKEFGTVARVASAAEVPGAVADYLAQQNLAPRFVLAPVEPPSQAGSNTYQHDQRDNPRRSLQPSPLLPGLLSPGLPVSLYAPCLPLNLPLSVSAPSSTTAT